MFFDIFKSIILGIVEGITEFLPISSTGHLILVNQLVSFDEKFTVLFDIVIQLGAIFAVVVYFWKRLWPFGSDANKNKIVWDIWIKVIIGVFPAIVLGKLFAGAIEDKLFNPITVAIALIIGGIVLIVIERRKSRQKIHSIREMNITTAIGIGFIQCFAMIPGTSRSAATIIGAMLLGMTRIAAAEFSFFLAIPTMIAASGYSLLKYGFISDTMELVILMTGFFVSFFTALLVVRYFMKFIQAHDFKIFGYYRIVLGIIVLLLFYFA